jgi:hypothetical protein
MAEIMKHTEGRVASAIWPIYLLLLPIPVVCFLALVTDIVYSASVFLMWLHFSMADRRRQHSLRGQQRCQVDEARSVLRRYA